MQKETVLFGSTRKTQIGAELERLYALQDRNATSQKLEIMADELEKTGLPLAAILDGIRSLHTADLKQIKFATLKEAMRRFIIQEAADACEYCEGIGLINMVDQEMQPAALACGCRTGQVKTQKQGIAAWNGLPQQTVNGGTLTVYDVAVMGEAFWRQMISNRRQRIGV